MNSGPQLTIFLKDGFHYGIPIEEVREVIHGAALIPAPVQVKGFIGFFDFRKRLCPVFDIQDLLDQKPQEQVSIPPSEALKNLIVVESAGIVFALWIGKYIESVALGADSAAQATDSDGGSFESEERPLVDQVLRYKGTSLSRLNLAYLGSFIHDHFVELLPPKGQGTESGAAREAEVAEREFLCFTIDTLEFGIPLVDLVEVIEGCSVEPLFKTNDFLRGLINLRGQIIACVDISGIIGLPKRRMEERNQYLLIQDRESDLDLALCIDTITKKRSFHPSRIQSVASLLNEELCSYLLGVIEDGESRIFILSGPRVIASKYLEPYQEQG
ncbi:MAG: chemotaxis protein CheW [Spirochaetota bacterium]